MRKTDWKLRAKIQEAGHRCAELVIKRLEAERDSAESDAETAWARVHELEDELRNTVQKAAREDS